MMNNLVIVNLRPNGTEVLPEGLTSLQWQTCLRRVVFLNRSEPLTFADGAEIYYGREAYQFLLKVICGLRSPLVGENAVMGQFRQFRNSAEFPNTEWGSFLREMTTDLLVDARQIRYRHLQSLGSQSYGSLIRKHLKGQSSVAVLGTGNLAREILPWLTEARVFYRNRQRASELKGEYPRIQLEQLGIADAGWESETASLVIAAPLDSTQINEWVGQQKVSFSLILDLRGTAAADPIHSNLPVINLSELMASLQSEGEKIADRVKSACEEIKALASQRVPARKSSTQEDCKSQIQTHSEARASLPWSEYLKSMFASRCYKRTDRPAPLPRTLTMLRTIKAAACLKEQLPVVPNQL